MNHVRSKLRSKKSSAWIALFGIAAFSASPFAPALAAGSPQFPQAGAAAAQEQQAPARGRIAGRVVGADTAQPLSKANVFLVSTTQPRENRSVRTDSGGVFEFTEGPAGTYRLRAERRGYVAQFYRQRGSAPGVQLNLAAGQILDRLEFRLEPAGVITGTVFDEDREPVEGIEVAALRVRFSPGGRRNATTVRSMRTNDLGEYRLAGLAPGVYYVQVGRGEGVSIGGPPAAASYATTFYPSATSREEARAVQVTSGSETRAIDPVVQSMATFSIRGTIADSSPGIGPRRYNAGFSRSGGTALMESPDGSFVLPGLAPGDYTLVATVDEEGRPTRRGYLNVRIVDSDVRVIIDVGRTAEVRGTVRTDDTQGFPLTGLRVMLLSEADQATQHASGIADSGVFEMRGLPGGEYRLQLSGRESELYLKEARCRTESILAAPLRLSPAEMTAGCTLVVSRAVGEVAGQVSEDNQPSEGLVVVLIPQEQERRRIPRHTMVAQSDAQGHFRIAGAIPGEYFVFAVPPSDDAAYYDFEFAERNLETAKRLKVEAHQRFLVELKPTKPR